MEHTGNHITLCGTLRALPEYSHSNHERRFFRFELEVERLSGTADVLPVMAAEDVLMAADLFAGGRFLVEGADPLVQLAGRERAAADHLGLCRVCHDDGAAAAERRRPHRRNLQTTHLPADAAGP